MRDLPSTTTGVDVVFPPHLDMEMPPPQPAPGRRARKRRYGTTYAGPGIDPIPPTPDVMDPAAGAWVREHVLTRAYLPGAPVGYLTHCQCQYGLCGACERGRCDRCLTLQFGGPRRSAITHVTDRRGFVKGMQGWNAAVFLTHTPCRYLCPCRCPKAKRAVATPAPKPEQLDLFDLVAAT